MRTIGFDGRSNATGDGAPKVIAQRFAKQTNPSFSGIRRIALSSICSWQAKNDITRQIFSKILNASNALSLSKGYIGFIFWYAAMTHFMWGTLAMF
ncbi:MAG: hypothetical protein ACSHYA_08085 [Opitutaceae bacterium]